MEMNPNHEVVQTLRGHWHSVLALVLMKLGEKEVVITEADLLGVEVGMCVVAHEKRDGLHIRLVSEAEGIALARQAGGLPA